MFDTVREVGAPETPAPTVEDWPPDPDGPPDEDWGDPSWLDHAPTPEELGQLPAAQTALSGWLGLELDHATADPARLSDADLIDAVVGYERLTSWAGARQARLMAEFARRRSSDYSRPTRSENPCRGSDYAPDEIALALRLSRTTATTRVLTARALVTELPATLQAWQDGTLDARKASAIVDASALLPSELHGALEARVLPRAGTQTLAQLRAALARAVIALDPLGAAERHEQRRQDRRVVLSPDDDGMATLWALLSAPDATAAYHRLSDLARSLGAEDPRTMDARRADLLVALLTGHPCPTHPGDHDNSSAHDDHDGAPANAHDGSAHDGSAQEDGVHHDDGASAPNDPAGASVSGQDTTHHTTAPDPTPSAAPDPASIPHPTTRPGKPLISVIVPITMLMGLDDQPGELVGYGPIPAPLAREIAAGGTWRRLLTDPASGTLLDYGRKTYTPPAGLADFVRARDLYCRNPICGHRASTADLDHTIAWDAGGTTCEHNLYAACRHDHLVKTFAPGWHVDQHPDATLTITTPTGHTYTSHPHNYHPEPHPPPTTTTPDTPPPTNPTPHTTTGHDPPDHDTPPF